MNAVVATSIVSALIWMNGIPFTYGDPGAFGNEILTLTNEILGGSAFKSYLRQGRKFETKRLMPDVMVKKLAQNVEEKIFAREKAIRNLKEVVAKSYEQKSWGYYTECCKYSDYDLNLVYDQRFLGKVDADALCIMRSSMATNKVEVPGEDFLRTALKNLKEFPGIKAQYFGSDGGTLLSFPASSVPNCGNYDNRFRPWYVKASAPVVKDVVIVMDMSGSMEEENRLQAAIHAATTILESLSIDDRVAVVAFSDFAYVLGSKRAERAISSKHYGGVRRSDEGQKSSCFETTMAKATPRNIHLLTNAVTKMVPHGGTNYTTGLKMAFDFLYDAFKRDVSASCYRSLSSPTEIAYSRHRTIIFLSDGKPSDAPSAILELIYRRNKQLHNSVVLLCYALGKGTFGHFIQRMAGQYYVPSDANKPCYSKLEDQSRCEPDGTDVCSLPPARSGLFRQVVDSQYLRSEMGSYYNYFASESAKVASFSKTESTAGIVWSVPYFDAGGLGMVVTVATPIVLKNRLVGVVGTDMTLREMMAEVTYFHAGGEMTYAFVIDLTGRVLLHPYMPSPSAVTEDPVLAHIEEFERSPEAREFLNGILKKVDTSDSQKVQDAKIHRATVYSKRVLPQEHRNVVTRSAKLTYSCVPVRHLVVCIVQEGETTTHTKFIHQDLPENFTFLYHRFDLAPPVPKCGYQFSLSSGARSAVFLAPSAFYDVGAHLGLPETTPRVSELQSFFEDESEYFMGSTPEQMAAATNVNPGIRDTVRATWKLEEIWKSQLPGRISPSGDLITLENLRRSVIYRYFSSEDGVFRILPGVQMPKSYNPVHRPWYGQAKSLLSQKVNGGKKCNSETCSAMAAISPPYLDASGVGAVVTVSQAIVARKMSGAGISEVDPWHVVGVIGGDIRLEFLEEVIRSTVTECVKDSPYKCVLIDLAGYVIYDSHIAEMKEEVISRLVKTSYHLTNAHKVMADVLVKNKVLVRRRCADVSKVAYLEEYRIDLELLSQLGESLPIKTIAINHTNTVLLVVSNDFWMPQRIGQEECIKHEHSFVTCERPFGSNQCESPCVNTKDASGDLETCSNTFNYTWFYHPPPCIPDKFLDERLEVIVEKRGAIESETKILNLEPCFDKTDKVLTAEEVRNASTTLALAIFAAFIMLVIQNRFPLERRRAIT